VTLSRQIIIDRYRQRVAASERTRLTKTDLAELIVEFIDQLAILKNKAKIQAACTAEIALLEEGYPQATIGKVYLPMYRKAIQTAIDDGLLPLTKNTSRQYTYTKRNSGETETAIDHFALDYLKYDSAIYSQFAGISAERNNLKQDNLQPVNPDAFLAVAANLLQSDDPFDLAVGIAATTGRRFSEVVAKGKMTATNDLYWISFSGQLKKRLAADSFLTPCLLPAAIVLASMERFRQHPRIAALADLSAIEINRSLADSVKRSVIRNFGDTGIVPILPSESAVTVHNLRGIYGEICTHFFCPPDRAVSRFVQERLGHVISADELKRANSSATQHYFHYYLVDSNGQHLGAKGIKLTTKEVQPITISSDPMIDLAASDTPLQLELLSASAASKTTKKTVNKKNIVDLTPENISLQDSTPPPASIPASIDPQQLATLQQEISRIWQHIAATDSVVQPKESSTPTASFNSELTAAHQRIAELEQKVLDLSQDNLAYQRRIEQLTNILQAPGISAIRVVKPPKKSAPPKSPRVPASVKISAAIEAIMLWNSQNEQKFAISQTLLLKVTGCNMPAIKQVLEAQAEMIDRYHAEHNIQPRHQAKKIDLVLSFLRNAIKSDSDRS
jgi:Telomere resolvase